MKNLSSIDLSDLMATKAGSVDPSKFPDEIFDLYSIPSFDSGLPEIAAGSSIGSAKQVVKPGDVLLSKIVPHIRRSWVVGNDRGRRLIASGEWIVFRSEKIEPRYLRHVLVGDPFHAQFMQTVSGVGGSLLRARPAQVSKIKIPLPPLSEQRRIAAILDQADALRAKRREALAQLDSLTQSIFVEMFGDPATSSSNWQTESLIEVCEEINDCPHSTPKWTESGVICLRTSNLTTGSWNWDDTRYVSETTYTERSKRGELKPGDIVLSREGTVGIAAIVTSHMRACMGQRLVQVRTSSNLLKPEYLLQHLLYVLSPKRIGQVMVGSTSQHLNVKELKSLRIPVPPLDDQVKFADRINALGSIKFAHIDSLAKFDSLFASLQHRAFRGEL